MHIKEIYHVGIASYSNPTMAVATRKCPDMDSEVVAIDTTRASAAIYLADQLLRKVINSSQYHLDEKQEWVSIDPYYPNNRREEANKEFVAFYTDRYRPTANTTAVTGLTKGNLWLSHYEQGTLYNPLKYSCGYNVAAIENKKQLENIGCITILRIPGIMMCDKTLKHPEIQTEKN